LQYSKGDARKRGSRIAYSRRKKLKKERRGEEEEKVEGRRRVKAGRRRGEQDNMDLFSDFEAAFSNPAIHLTSCQSRYKRTL